MRLPKTIKDGVHARAREREAQKQEMWDEICAWYLENPLPSGSRAYELAASKRDDHATMWIASPLAKKLETIAKRDDVSLARVIHTAAARYLMHQKK